MKPTPTDPLRLPLRLAVGQVEKDYNQARGPQSSRLPEASFSQPGEYACVEAAMTSV